MQSVVRVGIQGPTPRVGLADAMRRKIKAAADTDDSGTYDKLEMHGP